MDFKIPRKYTVGGQDVKVEFVESDGEKFGNMYDDMERGIPIGGIKETIGVLRVIEFVKHKYGIEK